MELKIYPDGSWEPYENNEEPIIDAPSDDYMVRDIPDNWDEEDITVFADNEANGRTQ